MKRRLLGPLLMLLSVSAQAFTLEEWRAWQADTPAFQSRIQQSRWLPATEIRVHAAGQLLFTPQRSLTWRWMTPQPSLAILDPTGQFRELTPSSAQPTITPLSETATDLPGDPQVGKLLLQLFQGNLAGLQEDYHLLLEGDTEAWKLVLLPRDRSGEPLKRIVIEGGRFIDSLLIVAPSGNELQLSLDAPRPLVETQGAQQLQQALAAADEAKAADQESMPDGSDEDSKGDN